MAEVTTSRWHTVKQDVSRRAGAKVVEDKTHETVRVWSIQTERMDASVLYDLVEAMQSAGIDGRATVTASTNNGHLTQLKVEHTREIADEPLVDEPVESVPA